MAFKNELDFEKTIVDLLVKERGWDGGVLYNPTEKDLIKNWADVLFKINNEIDKLNGVPLNDDEMSQLMNKINSLNTPNERNAFINGKSIDLRRENPDDKLHFGREISLKIFDRNEIAAGSSIYQIARQPIFAKDDPVQRNRRGDFMLLINGLPVIHVELKNEGIPLNNAINQIQTYLDENKFRGFFSLVQIFVAMTPSKMRYFANPGSADAMNPDYFFYWSDFNNEPREDWKTISFEFLSIPMAHQLIGYYTVADGKDGILKVMRSYQIYAAREIVDRVREKQANNWSIKDQYGGYIWHTTGSGKTLTAFKSAELLAQLGYADKVVFLVDRITLADQSGDDFKGFSNYEEIYETKNTDILINLLEDKSVGRLIVTSIQKMSNVVDNELDSRKLEEIKKKRIVFIVDEAHRSTFGVMMTNIKNTYPNAMFFGFTGTPIQTKTDNTDSTEITTADIFGNELHHYTLADGIRDGNVLSFDITKVQILPEMEIRRQVALEKACVKSIDDIDDENEEIYQEWMDTSKHSMLEVEAFAGSASYETPKYQAKVVESILSSWKELNRTGEFSAIFATSSIKEAIQYWRLLKDNPLNLKVTALFDANDDFSEFSKEKNDGLVDILKHYNSMFKKDFSVSTHSGFKKDLSNRLAQKTPYKNISKDNKIDIVIVVYQLLTGYDSKWVSMLFLDKLLEMHNLIQAISRTNRLNGRRKPHGIIKYYRKTATMEYNISRAVEEYSGNNPYMMFVDKLPVNIKKINREFEEISDVFELNKIKNFSRLPEDSVSIDKFVESFNSLIKALDLALAQGFSWEQRIYNNKEKHELIELIPTEEEYITLLMRYKEIETDPPGGPKKKAYNIDPWIFEEKIKIDYDYMNENFEKYIKALNDGEDTSIIRSNLHKNFAKLSRERQSYAQMILNDIESGDFNYQEGWSFNDYINAYSVSELDKQIKSVVDFTGVDENKLRELLGLKLPNGDINEYGRFDSLKDSADKDLLAINLSKLKGEEVSKLSVILYLDEMLRSFILDSTFYIEDYNETNGK